MFVLQHASCFVLRLYSYSVLLFTLCIVVYRSFYVSYLPNLPYPILWRCTIRVERFVFSSRYVCLCILWLASALRHNKHLHNVFMVAREVFPSLIKSHLSKFQAHAPISQYHKSSCSSAEAARACISHFAQHFFTSSLFSFLDFKHFSFVYRIK